MATKKKMLQAAAGQAGGAGLDVEDVFSTYLYDGTGAAQTIANGIDLDGEGGAILTKRRDSSSGSGPWFNDTERGITKYISTSSTSAETDSSSSISAVTSSGYTLGTFSGWNNSAGNYASWTFRKAPKFFDVVTYTGDGTNGRQISHNLGNDVGMMLIKKTSSSDDWRVFHRSQSNKYAALNSTFQFQTDGGNIFGNPSNGTATAPTSTHFTVANDASVNQSGGTYVAYLFAHNDGDGGFGPDGDADIIKCGSYTTDSNEDATIDLGFEPQWVLAKRTDSSTGGTWMLFDSMRGMQGDFLGQAALLEANDTNAETNVDRIAATPTGFKVDNYGANRDYIYMAIRRGTKVPESGTEVFAIDAVNSSEPYFTSGFPIDMAFYKSTSGSSGYVSSRLTGLTEGELDTTAAFGSATAVGYDKMTGFLDAAGNPGANYYAWMWKRAPGYFDAVAYTGNGVQGRNITHNLGVAPDMIWVKNRDDSVDWAAYVSGITHLSVFGSDPDSRGDNPVRLELNTTEQAQFSSSGVWDHTHPTDTVFRVGDTNATNGTGDSLIAYLFATLPGISKVGSFSHTYGGTTNVDCGFTSGARFVLWKRTDGTRHWEVFDTTRGIVAGNDAYLRLSDTAAQTSGDYIDPYSAGFSIGSALGSGSYIFYAIA